MAEQSASTPARAAARVVSLTPRMARFLAEARLAGFSQAEAERLLFVCWLAYTGRLSS